MATAVGLWIGAATSTAAIVRGDASDTDAPEFVERDTEFVELNVLYTTEDGSTTLGVAPDAPLARTATGFIDMVGNPDGIVLDDGVAYRAEDLLATGVFCLIEDCPADVDPDTASLALAHPQDWTSETVTAVIESLNYLGLRSVSLVPVDAAPTSSGHTRPISRRSMRLRPPPSRAMSRPSSSQPFPHPRSRRRCLGRWSTHPPTQR